MSRMMAKLLKAIRLIVSQMLNFFATFGFSRSRGKKKCTICAWFLRLPEWPPSRTNLSRLFFFWARKKSPPGPFAIDYDVVYTIGFWFLLIPLGLTRAFSKLDPSNWSYIIEPRTIRLFFSALTSGGVKPYLSFERQSLGYQQWLPLRWLKYTISI